ncbi:hypothetical protein, partial [Nonomuraea fuscirosea]|uniref:hypothetical protein n=1 Tax=Nonomuraea fuscirosea TaxID=1291556 RepID=UPI0033D8BE38
MTAVPLLGFAPGAATLCFCVLAAVAAAAQPFAAEPAPMVWRAGKPLAPFSHPCEAPPGRDRRRRRA